MSKGEGEHFAKQTMKDAEYIAKKAKGHTVGNPFPEEFDLFDTVLSEITAAGYSVEQALAYMVYEAQYARNNPEKYEREQRRSQSSRERRMNDPKTGINSPAFMDFYNKQMGRKKKTDEQYTINVADVKGGTQAAKNAQAGMKGKDGQPLYKPGVGVGADFKLKGV
jgi:hypothetical protein